MVHLSDICVKTAPTTASKYHVNRKFDLIFVRTFVRHCQQHSAIFSDVDAY